MTAARLAIPAGIDFADLKLTRKPTGTLSFDWAPVEAVCAASGIDIALFRDTDEGNIAGLLVAWYEAHLANGGTRDATMDDLLAETAAEAAAGHGLSHPAGRA